MGEIDHLLDAALREIDKLRFQYKACGVNGVTVSQAEGVESIVNRLLDLVYAEGVRQ